MPYCWLWTDGHIVFTVQLLLWLLQYRCCSWTRYTSWIFGACLCLDRSRSKFRRAVVSDPPDALSLGLGHGRRPFWLPFWYLTVSHPTTWHQRRWIGSRVGPVTAENLFRTASSLMPSDWAVLLTLSKYFVSSMPPLPPYKLGCTHDPSPFVLSSSFMIADWKNEF